MSPSGVHHTIVLRDRAACAVGLALLVASCGVDAVRPAAGALRVQPGQLDFGRVIRGQAAEKAVELINEGRAPLEVTAAVDGPGFSLLAMSALLPPGTTSAGLRFAPDAAGVFEGKLTVSARGAASFEVALSGEGAPIPECGADAPCLWSAWSDAEGRCVEGPLPDGTACTERCLVDATCLGGRCVGAPRGCDDGNPCTVDTCAASGGCSHDEPVVCASAGPCQVGVCDPSSGCGLAPAPDGTPCGPRRGCDAADVCVGGACVLRDPPDGFVCADESPCQGAGRCAADVCVQPPATELQPVWQRGATPVDGGQGDVWSDLLVDADGRVTLSSYFMSRPVLDARSAAPVSLMGAARRCILWRRQLVCADFPGGVVAGVSAMDPSTGAIAWTYASIAAALPEYAGPTVQVFLARLMALSEQLLVAVFEARTLDPDGHDPRCRRFALVVLDAQGQAVAARRIEHPTFEVCTHPHPYGAAVDASGNLYLAFSPSQADNPASALEDTLLMSYSATLQPRWTRWEPSLPGGELSVAAGRLLHERSSTPYSTGTGAPDGLLAVPFGLGVVSRELVIAAPGDRASVLEAVDRTTLASRWRRSAPAASWFTAAPLALATFQTRRGPRPVVLAFVSDGMTRGLSATDVETGAEVFQCPLAIAAPPGLVSPALGGLALGVPVAPASGDVCSRCDPRYAERRLLFTWFELVGLSPGPGRWLGQNGGPGHDHREDAAP